MLLTFTFGLNYPRDSAQPEEKKFCRSPISLGFSLESLDFLNKRRSRNSSTLVFLFLNFYFTKDYYDCPNDTFV